MTRFLDFLARIFQLIPPSPRPCAVLLSEPSIRVSGHLIRRWPRIVLIGEDGARFEVEREHVRLIALAPEGYHAGNAERRTED